MSVRDEMAEAMKKIKVFRPSPADYADALTPIVERVARESAIQGVMLGSSAGMGEAFHRHIDEIVRRVVGSNE